MQVYTEKSIDARSFPEIWATLNKGEKDDLVYELLKNKCCTTRTAINQWGRGVRTPANYAAKDIVARSIGKVLGLKVHSATLFPRS